MGMCPCCLIQEENTMLKSEKQILKNDMEFDEGCVFYD